MAINNPLIPGDPFSYDLKWLVRTVKEQGILLDSIDNSLDTRIESAIVEFLDQHDPVYYQTAQDMIESEAAPGSLAYIQGYHAPGDGGGNLYYITDDYNDVLAATFYITLEGPNRWGIPVILTPYVTPEMFGAYGDGVNDDGPAFNVAIKYKNVICAQKTYNIGTRIYINASDITLTGNHTVLKNEGYHKTIDCSREDIENISVDGFTFTGMGKENQSSLWPNSNGGIVIATNKKNITVKNCVFKNMPYGVFIGGEGSENTEISSCQFESCWSAIDTFTTNGSIIADCVFKSCRQPIQLEPNENEWYNDCIVRNCITRDSDEYSINIHSRGRRLIVTGCYFDNIFKTTASDFEDCVVDNCTINQAKHDLKNSFGGNTIIQNCHIVHGRSDMLTPWTGIIKNNVIENTDTAIWIGGSSTSSCKMFDNIVLIPNESAMLQGGGTGTATIIGVYLPQGRIVTGRTYTDIVFTGYVGGQTPTDSIQLLNTTMKYYNAPSVQ